jgi:hypothetical protein
MKSGTPKSNKSLLQVLGVFLLVWLVYEMAEGAGLLILALVALIAGVLSLIPPLFWTIFFAVGFALLIFGH